MGLSLIDNSVDPNGFVLHDAKPLTSWIPGAKMSNEIRASNGIHTNDQFRSFMQKNADKIIDVNQRLAASGCCDCQVHYTNGSVTPNNPYLYSNQFEKTKPFGYQNSDLKEIYLSSLQLNSRLYTPVITQYQLLTQGYPNYN